MVESKINCTRDSNALFLSLNPLFLPSGHGNLMRLSRYVNSGCIIQYQCFLWIVSRNTSLMSPGDCILHQMHMKPFLSRAVFIYMFATPNSNNSVQKSNYLCCIAVVCIAIIVFYYANNMYIGSYKVPFI